LVERVTLGAAVVFARKLPTKFKMHPVWPDAFVKKIAHNVAQSVHILSFLIQNRNGERSDPRIWGCSVTFKKIAQNKTKKCRKRRKFVQSGHAGCIAAVDVYDNFDIWENVSAVKRQQTHR
jgi:hypothetical protein